MNRSDDSGGDAFPTTNVRIAPPRVSKAHLVKNRKASDNRRHFARVIFGRDGESRNPYAIDALLPCVELTEAVIELGSKTVRWVPWLCGVAGRVAATSMRREMIVVSLGSLALAMAMTWPTLANPSSTIPDNLGDPVYEAWAMSWFAHALFSQPLNLFQANAFWPLGHSLAYTDLSPSLSVFAIGANGPTDALLRYNIAFVSAAAVDVIGAYSLARQLGSGRLGAAVAGAAFAFTPWHLAHWSHLNILFTGGIPLTFALLLRGHGIGKGGWRTECSRPALLSRPGP